jgi:hypothetical protein
MHVYGIINSSFKKYIVDVYGDEKAAEITDSSGVKSEVFNEYRRHDDENTLALLMAAVEFTGETPDHHLRQFGRFWVRRVATNDFRGLIDSYGGDFVSLIQNLNSMHKEISGTFLDYSPPSFAIQELTESRYSITYQSHRQGFTPFVLGILEELGDFYGLVTTIEAVETTLSDKGEKSVICVEILKKVLEI